MSLNAPNGAEIIPVHSDGCYSIKLNLCKLIFTKMNRTVVSNIKYRLFVVSGLRHAKILALSFKSNYSMDRLHTVDELQTASV